MRAEKVAIFLPDLAGGGAERATLALAGGFAEAGWSSRLVLAKATGALRGEIPDAVGIVDLAARGTATSLPALIAYLRRERPTALISAMTHANIVAIAAGALARRPTRVVVVEHTTLSRAVALGELDRGRLISWLVERLYPRAHAIVAVSAGVADDLAMRPSLTQTPIVEIPNPLLLDRAQAQSRLPLSDPWFAQGEPPVIVAIGRLTPAKDLATFLHGLAELRRHCTFRAVILGEGPLRGELEGLTRELELEPLVRFLGFQENPYKYLARSAVFVMSSRREGLPTALIEALALGVPVVATDCESGPREILAGGSLGKLVDVGDAHGLAAAIQSTLEEPSDPRLRCDAARAQDERYDVHDVTARFRALLSATPTAGHGKSAQRSANEPA